jgi:hypothetical protein
MKKGHIHLKSPGIRTAIVLSVKFLPHKNIFTHSFVSINDYPMSEVSN